MAFLVLGVTRPGHALLPEERLDDPHLEERARELSAQLRCLVCQNQTIDDSDAPFARDMRALIRAEIKAGKNEDQIITFLRQRYGDYVLLNPPLTGMTAFLWAAPFAMLAAGFIGIVFVRRRKNDPGGAQ
jgi:cytochrome c-type biogenesis protein CcmH